MGLLCRVAAAGCTLVAMTMALMACDRHSPATTAPSVAADLTPRLAVTIDNLGSAIALPAVSRIRFDASGSAVTNGPMQYMVDYGDHASSSDAVSEHTASSSPAISLSELRQLISYICF